MMCPTKLFYLFSYLSYPSVVHFLLFALYHGRVNVLLIINPSILNIYLLLLCSFHRSDFVGYSRLQACNAPSSTFRGCLQQMSRVASVAHTCRLHRSCQAVGHRDSRLPNKRFLPSLDNTATSQVAFDYQLDLTSSSHALVSKTRNSTLTRILPSLVLHNSQPFRIRHSPGN
jgi:hypothetical protein